MAGGCRGSARLLQRVHEKRKIIAYILHMYVYNTPIHLCTERIYTRNWMLTAGNWFLEKARIRIACENETKQQQREEEWEMEEERKR